MLSLSELWVGGCKRGGVWGGEKGGRLYPNIFFSRRRSFMMMVVSLMVASLIASSCRLAYARLFAFAYARLVAFVFMMMVVSLMVVSLMVVSLDLLFVFDYYIMCG